MRKTMEHKSAEGKLVRYIPARHTEGKVWYISYYAENPFSSQKNKLHRIREKLNRIKNVNERRRYARQRCEDINRLLRQGWNPFLQEVAPKGMDPFCEVIELFLKRKAAELRPESMRSYNSRGHRMIQWLKLIRKSDLRAAAFSLPLARDYMEHCLDQGVGPTTYNNNITFGRLLFNWMKERQYCADNPFDQIKRLKERDKFRQIIPPEWRDRIKNYLEENNPGFLLACMLQFYAEIRPTEQTKISVKDVDLERRVIRILPSAAKTGTQRFPTIPNELMPYLKALPWDTLNPSSALIGKGFVPGGQRMINAREYTLEWKRMRKALGMPKEYQFYSLRDSGIVHMLESGVPINQVMRQAGHTDLESTTRYVKYVSPEAVPQIKGLKKGF